MSGALRTLEEACGPAGRTQPPPCHPPDQSRGLSWNLCSGLWASACRGGTGRDLCAVGSGRGCGLWTLPQAASILGVWRPPPCLDWPRGAGPGHHCRCQSGGGGGSGSQCDSEAAVSQLGCPRGAHPPGASPRPWVTGSFLLDERDRVQKKTFTKWVNKHLIKVGGGGAARARPQVGRRGGGDAPALSSGEDGVGGGDTRPSVHHEGSLTGLGAHSPLKPVLCLLPLCWLSPVSSSSSSSHLWPPLQHWRAEVGASSGPLPLSP